MKYLLAVTGSISAYRAYDLLREYLRAGHNVRVILSSGAEKFVSAQMFRYLGAEAVYASEEDFKYPHHVTDTGTVLHVELAKWCDKFIVAPLSANSLGRFARGEATDLMSSVFLTIEQHKPILMFPAMNTHMLEHPFTREHLTQITKLKSLKQIFIHPTMEGELACGDVGSGKLAPIEEIAALTETWNANSKNKKVLITTGATVAPLDNVRFLTNSSSGTTGYALAQESLARGFETVVVAGIYATNKLELLKYHPGFTLIRVRTPSEMLSAVQPHFKSATAYISSAAVGDIEFEMSQGKLKKDQLSNTLTIKPGVDILKTVLSERTSEQTIIGFAAEYDLSDDNLKNKMARKSVDFLVGTEVDNGLVHSQNVKGFRTDSANYAFIYPNGNIVRETLAKSQMAKLVLDQVKHV